MKLNIRKIGVGLIMASAVFAAGCTTNETKPDPAPRVDNKAISMDHFRQGIMFTTQKDFDNAIREFQAAVNIDPTNAHAYSNMGVAYMQIGKYNLARDALSKSEHLSPNDPVILYNQTAYYSVMNQADRALVYLDKSLANGFNNFEALRSDTDLDNIRNEMEFRTILEKHRVFIN